MNKVTEKQKREALYIASRSGIENNWVPIKGQYFIKSIEKRSYNGRDGYIATTTWRQDVNQEWVNEAEVVIMLNCLYHLKSKGDKHLNYNDLLNQTIEVFKSYPQFEIVNKVSKTVFVTDWMLITEAEDEDVFEPCDDYQLESDIDVMDDYILSDQWIIDQQVWDLEDMIMEEYLKKKQEAVENQ